MLILAFKPSIPKYFGSHDASTALLKNDQIIGILEEERLSRKKHATNQFPILSIKRLLRDNGLNMSDISHFTIPYNPPEWQKFSKQNKQIIIEDANKLIIEKLTNDYSPDTIPPISYYNHHYCHAASAFYLSGFNDAIIVTADGTGESETTTIWKGENGKIKILKRIHWPHSLGELYATITGYLGFTPNSGEGKTMGLAPYGNKKNQFINDIFLKHIVKFEKDNFQLLSPQLTASTWEERYNFLENIIPFSRLKEKKYEIIDSNYKDLAAVLQFTIESIMINIINKGKELFLSNNLCLAGGLAMNVSMNNVIFESTGFKNIFIQPLAGDNGCMLGAALIKWHELSGQTSFPRMEHLYYGTSYSNREIEDILKSKFISYKFIKSPEEEAAKLLAEGEIIGRFSGRMEAGARSLGNRSILSHPGLLETKDNVNELKNREKWRPLALSIIEEEAHQYLEGNIPDCAQYMIISRQIKNDKRGKIPSALHIDNSTRPQVVKEKTNPSFYKLINEFYKLTGIPLILNTSLNDRGEPIVEHPEQAINYFFKSGIKALFLENYLITN